MQEAPNGDVQLAAWRYDGTEITYIPKKARKAHRARLKARTARPVADIELWRRQYARTRLTPKRLAAWQRSYDAGRSKSEPAKYIAPPDEKVPPFPMPRARARYQDGATGGVGIFIEGEKKAIALDLAGMESVAFAGIGMYNMKRGTANYITRRRHDSLGAVYDGDCFDVRTDKQTGLVCSKRPQDFYNSAVRFFGALFDHLAEIGHEPKVYWCAVNPEAGPKGADDLLAASDDRKAIADELANFQNGKNWLAYQLHPTTYRKRLAELFALHSPKAFYQRHQQAIGQRPFTWWGETWQVIEGTPVLLSNPFSIEVAGHQCKIRKYLCEITQQLDDLLASNRVLAIASTTGTGKTTWLIDYARRTGKKLVLAVHTRALCVQLAKDHSILGIYGNNTVDRAADGAAAQIVVATYDTVHHLPDLADRVLAIDEAHHLVNSYGRTRGNPKLFRATTLTRLIEIAQSAPQVVYLSGTMPTALLAAYDVPLVEVELTNPTPVRLHRITSRNTKAPAATEALLADLVNTLSREDDAGKVHLAMYDNTDQIELVHDYLIKGGHLTADQVQTVTRRHINAGRTEGYEDITERSLIRPGVRLVLTTCLLAEGVNVENVNVGKVYAVHPKCPDKVRQWAARLRKMASVDLYLILPPDSAPRRGFSGSAQIEIEMLTQQAALQAKQANALSEAGQLEHYDRANLFPLVRPNSEGDRFTADRLAILASVRDRMLDTAPPAFLVGRLLAYSGFSMAPVTAPVNNPALSGQLKATHKAVLADRKVKLTNLRHQLKSDADTPLAALYLHYQRTGNRHGAAKVRSLAAGAIERTHPTDAARWREANLAALRLKDGRELIRRTGQLIFAGVDDYAPYLQLSAGAWRKEWKRTTTTAGLRVLETRHRARQLPAGLHLDLRAKQAYQKLIEQHIEQHGSQLTDRELVDLLLAAKGQDRRRRLEDAPLFLSYHDITPRRARSIADELFEMTTTRNGTYYVHQIGEKWQSMCVESLAHKCTNFLADPLKIKALRE